MTDRDMLAEYEEKRKATGDLRVPSNPDTYRPPVPPASLTKSGSASSDSGEEASEGGDE